MTTVKNNEKFNSESIKSKSRDLTGLHFAKDLCMKFLKFRTKPLICFKTQTARRSIAEIGMNGYSCLKMMSISMKKRQRTSLWYEMRNFSPILMKISWRTIWIWKGSGDQSYWPPISLICSKSSLLRKIKGQSQNSQQRVKRQWQTWQRKKSRFLKVWLKTQFLETLLRQL